MIWQETRDSRWKTNEDMVCDRCGRKTDEAIGVLTGGGVFMGTFCWHRSCFKDCLGRLFAEKDAQHLFIRHIGRDVARPRRGKRVPVGLSLRYTILRRDGFQCKVCGASGKSAKLEVDHILPVSAGGMDVESNLQTLCFACNRGKRDKT